MLSHNVLYAERWIKLDHLKFIPSLVLPRHYNDNYIKHETIISQPLNKITDSSTTTNFAQPSPLQRMNETGRTKGDSSLRAISNISSSIISWLTSSARLGSEGQLSEFIEGLGPGQLVGRQVLASPALGDIQLSMSDRRGHLEVEVIRARGLQCKPGSKTQPGRTTTGRNE